MSIKAAWYLVKDAATEWSDDNVSRLSAALAYYTVFSIAPVLVIVLAIVGFFLGGQGSESRVMEQFGAILGPEGASALQSLAQQQSQKPTSGIVATAISLIVLVFTASGVFYELQTSLDTVWDVQPRSQGIWGILKSRLLSFSIIPVIGFLLIVSLVMSAGIAAFGSYLGSLVPGMTYLLQAANFLLSFVVIGLLFALIYKILPDARIEWRDVWLGAGVTSLLFSLGKFAIGLYLAKSSTSSMYGAAGSLVILLAWVYYSAQIFFFGAEFTQVYANRYGSRVKPAEGAEAMPEEMPEASRHPSRGDDEGRPEKDRSPAGEKGSEGKQARSPGRVPGSTERPARRSRMAAMEAAEAGKEERPSFVALTSFLGGLLTGLFLRRPRKAA